MAVDTLSIAHDLRAANFAQLQADAVASAIGRAVLEGAATKADLATLRADLKTDIAEMKASLLTWFIGSQIALGALLVAAIKL